MLITILLLLPILIIVNDLNYYHYAFEKYGVYQDLIIDKSNLELIIRNIFDYLNDKAVNLYTDAMHIDGALRSFYTQRDLWHMVDVKNLYLLFKTILYISLSFFLFLITLVMTGKVEFNFKDFFKAYQHTLVVFIFMIIGIGSYALIDFERFWINFHEVLFTNDLYLLDPSYSCLIRMLPLGLFNELVLRIVSGVIVLIALSYFIFRFLFRRLR